MSVGEGSRRLAVGLDLDRLDLMGVHGREELRVGQIVGRDAGRADARKHQPQNQRQSDSDHPQPVPPLGRRGRGRGGGPVACRWGRSLLGHGSPRRPTGPGFGSVGGRGRSPVGHSTATAPPRLPAGPAAARTGKVASVLWPTRRIHSGSGPIPAGGTSMRAWAVDRPGCPKASARASTAPGADRVTGAAVLLTG